MKYWAYINNEILGPYEKEKLLELPVFSATTLICPQTPVGEKTEDWKEASTYPEIAAMPGFTGAPAAAQPNPGNVNLPPATGEGLEQIKPVTDSPQPGISIERPQPVFNTDIPENKLKPLSLHSIDQTPPAAAPNVNGANFKVNQLVSGRGRQGNSAPQPAPSFTSANFDPVSISQIGKRAEAPGLNMPQQDPPKQAEAQFKAPEAVSPAPSFTPAPEAAPIPVFENKQAAPIDKKSLDEINSRLETLTSNSLTKQDIEPLKEKLNQMGEVLSLMKGNQFQREIMDKMQYLENSLSDIKASLIVKSSGSMVAPQPAKNSSPASTEPRKPAEAAKPKIVDQGSGGKASKLPEVVKKIFKLIITLILLAAVTGGAAFALKYFGVFDATKFLPFPIPFLSAPQPAETPAPQPFQAETVAPRTEPVKKDLSPEIIFIGRTFPINGGETTLENRIYEAAVAKKGDFNRTTWQVKELTDGIFELDAVIPSMDGMSQLLYRYEVDYAKKAVRPLDETSAKPLEAKVTVDQAPKQNKAQIKKDRPGAATRSRKQPKPAAKSAVKQAARPAKVKPAAAADEEYEYMYEDEAGGTEE